MRSHFFMQLTRKIRALLCSIGYNPGIKYITLVASDQAGRKGNALFVTLGRFIYRQRKLVVLGGLLFLIISIIFGTAVLDLLSGSSETDPHAESSQVDALVHQQFQNGEDALVVMFTARDHSTVDDPTYQQAVAATLNRVKGQPGVGSITDYYSTKSPRLVSADRHSTYAVVGLRGDSDADLKALRPLLISDYLQVRLGGGPAASADILDQVSHDLALGEQITLPIVAFLLILIFGSLVAAALPLAIGGLAILGAFLALRVLVNFTAISIFSINVIIMLGLGLAIDYSLFIVSRFREELKSDPDVAAAIVVTVRTAGRTVMFSGLTVTICLLSLLFFPQQLLRSVAWGGAAAVLVAMLAALTVLPALLALLGQRVNALSLRGLLRRKKGGPPPAPTSPGISGSQGFWYRLSNLVMTHPVIVLLLTLGLLVGAGLPFLHVNFATPDARNIPAGRESRVVSEILDAQFAANGIAPIQVLVQSSGDALAPTSIASLYDYTRALAKLPGVTRVDSLVTLDPRLDAGGANAYVAFYAPASRAQNPAAVAAAGGMARGSYSLAQVYYNGDPHAAANQQLVRAIRALPTPAGLQAQVGGETASLLDLLDGEAHTIPLALGTIVAIIFVLLFLMLGSLVIPLKAVILNILSLSVSFGALVWIFQDGNLAGLLGFTPMGSIDANQPVLIFAIAFGLSMDYEVFLISRIKESFDRTGDNTASVALGVQKTGGIITSAALLLVMVLAGFGLGQVVSQKEVAIGLCLAILVDATLVRLLLVPAAMRLIGRYNWWSPAPLTALYRRLGMGETSSEASAATLPVED